MIVSTFSMHILQLRVIPVFKLRTTINTKPLKHTHRSPSARCFKALYTLSQRNMIGKHIACVSVQATLQWLGFEGVVL